MIERTYRCKKIIDFPSDWGQVIQCPSNVPTFYSELFSYWDRVSSFPIDGQAVVSWFEVKRRRFTVCEVERHCLTPEVLLCIEGSAVCFVGKPTDSEKLYPEEFGAFYLEEKKGFLFNPRTWHAIPFPMTEKAVFWVIFREGTAQSDLEILDLEKEKRFRFQISVNTTE